MFGPMKVSSEALIEKNSQDFKSSVFINFKPFIFACHIINHFTMFSLSLCCNFYHLQQYFLKGNDFTNICMPMGEETPRQKLPRQTPSSMQNPPGQTHPPWQTHLGSRHPQTDTPLDRQTYLGRHPLGRHPISSRHPLGRHTPDWDPQADNPMHTKLLWQADIPWVDIP